MQRSSEIEYLRWFAINADFGPADGDVRIYLQDKFEKETGKLVADGWRYRDYEDGE